MSEDDHSKSDADTFRTAMRDVEPLRSERQAKWKPKPKPLPKPRAQQDLELSEAAESDTPEFLDFRRPGIQDRLYRDLSRGVVAPEAAIDLHGMRVAEARPALARFLQQSLERGRRCIRIVHGKGYRSQQQPVLKQCVNQWLQQRPEVLAFCSAPRWDGGSGAAYVLLSRKHRRLP